MPYTVSPIVVNSMSKQKLLQSKCCNNFCSYYPCMVSKKLSNTKPPTPKSKAEGDILMVYAIKRHSGVK